MKDFGITLKGGLARGFASVGAMRFFQEEGLMPKVVAGSSSGGLLAVAIALNIPWEIILERMQKFRFKSITSPRSLVFNSTLVKYDKLKKALLDMFPEYVHGDLRLEELPIKTLIFATDPRTKERVVFDKGNVMDVLIASSGYPIVFPSVLIEGKRYLDGDLTPGYTPSHLRKFGAKKVIGISYVKKGVQATHVPKNIVNKFLEIMMLPADNASKITDSIDPVDLEITYNAGDYGYFDFKNIDKVAQRAYRAARAQRKEIAKLLS